ncbi:DUF3027 domain-containing protein [Nakamurella alba]|uniref:DUF3027 domain-containing protein n=1 Tax=Nakamurella alba TaxID=2665158 RepID=UPI002AC35E7C|nr:DUF3027 domain-containing protein [Nakamurella alba]
MSSPTVSESADSAVESSAASVAAIDAPVADVRTPVTLPMDAIDIARAALAADLPAGTAVGEYAGAVAEDEVAVSALFAATDPGYRGWVWSVTLAFVGDDRPTVSEVVLLPGHDALLAPDWLPWSERIRSGDIGPGDLLPPPVDDPRLVPAYVQSDDPAVEDVAHELGIGRVRVMSRDGRADVAERWHDGPFGPSSDMAHQAPARCSSCGFYLPLAGSLGVVAGACGNEFGPAEGRVVDAGYGCGAHSEVVVELPPLSAAGENVVDELRLEVHPRPEREVVTVADGEPDLSDISAVATDLAELSDVAELAELDGGDRELVPTDDADDLADLKVLDDLMATEQAAEEDAAHAAPLDAAEDAVPDGVVAEAVSDLPDAVADLPEAVAEVGAGTVADFSEDSVAETSVAAGAVAHGTGPDGDRPEETDPAESAAEDSGA